MTDNPNMKRMTSSKRRCRYRILLEEQVEEQTDQLKKRHALIQELSVGVRNQTDRKSSDNLELGILQFTVDVQWFFCKERKTNFHRYPRRGGGVNLIGGGDQDANFYRCL